MKIITFITREQEDLLDSIFKPIITSITYCEPFDNFEVELRNANFIKDISLMQDPILQDEISIREHKRRFIYLSNWTTLRLYDLEDSVSEDELLDEQKVYLKFYRDCYKALKNKEVSVQELVKWYRCQTNEISPDKHFLLRCVLTPSDLPNMTPSSRQYKTDVLLGIKWYNLIIKGNTHEIRYRLGFGWEVSGVWYPDLLSAIEAFY